MTDTLAAKQKSAAVPDPEFDRLSLAEKRAWLERYLEEGRRQVEDGRVVRLASDADVEALFETIRAEAHEKAGLDR